MRMHFISRLALLLVASFLVVASQVWTGGTLEWLFIVAGIVMLALAATGLGSDNRVQQSLDGLVGLLGIWSIVEALIFNGSSLEWVSFATAIVGAGLGVIGLAVHETTTERVVHELSVTSTGRTGPRESVTS